LTTSAIAKAKDWKTRLSLAAPGLAARLRYEGSNLSHDMVAELSVVAKRRRRRSHSGCRFGLKRSILATVTDFCCRPPMGGA
jgi:hypothetical protein